jgi:hypothetical protein
MAAPVPVVTASPTAHVTAPGPELDDRLHPGETTSMAAVVAEAATRRTAAEGGQLTRAEMLAVLEVAGWPEELREQAMAVAWCESRWSPWALGDGGSSRGLMQLWLGWFAWAGEDPTRWMDPVVNARVALRVVERDLALGRDAWAQWSCRPF